MRECKCERNGIELIFKCSWCRVAAFRNMNGKTEIGTWSPDIAQPAGVRDGRAL